MAENFLSYYSSLKAWVPFLPVELAKRLVNRARRDIYDSRLWSFLIVQTQITCPAIITAGSVTVTQYSNQLTGDAIASAAWTGLSNPVITFRQFRQAGGPLYNITAADFTVPAAVVLTLDRPYQEPSGTLQAYNIYQCFYPPTDPSTNAPTADFIKWISVYDPINGYPLRINATQEWINTVDPTRGAVGQPYHVASYKEMPVSGSSDPVPFFELWPAPTDGVSRIGFYMKGGADWTSPTDSLPTELPTELIEVRSRYRAYEWANANKGSHAELQKTDWLAMMRQIMDVRDRGSYPWLIQKAKAKDEERYQINFVQTKREGFIYPYDSNFLQSHAFSYFEPWEIAP